MLEVQLPPQLNREKPIRIAVLAEGAITPLGNNADETWESFKAMQSGIVEHLYPPYTEPSFQIPDKIITAMITAHPLLGRLLEIFGDTPTTQRFILDEYLAEHTDIKAEDIKMNKRDPQIRACTAGTVKNFDAMKLLVESGFMPRGEVRDRLDPYAQYGLAASFEALRKVRTSDGVDLLVPRLKSDGTIDKAHQWIINESLIHPLHFATFVGTGFGGGDVTAEVWDKLRAGYIPDEHMMRSLSDRAASSNTQGTGTMGGAEANTAACASSGKAILNAIARIALGWVEVALVVGTEGVLGRPIASAMFDAMGALDRGRDPLTVSRSLHKVRRGFTMAEGAVAFVIADYDWARRNNLPILYEIIGVGDTSGAGHNTDPNTTAQELAMRLAKRRAEQHGPIEGKLLVSGHFTGTVKGEASEMLAIRNALGDSRDRTIIYASKRLAGHTQGAAGNLSLLVAGKALQEGVVPGMVFDGEIMDEAEGWDIPRETRLEPELSHAKINQFGFGDANVSIWLRKAA